MTYKVDWCENKGEGWKVVTLVKEDKTSLNNVSINRKSKNGDIFPGFDEIMPGSDLEGDLWQSPAGKWYLFAPKEANSAPTAHVTSPSGTLVTTKKLSAILRYIADELEK